MHPPDRLLLQGKVEQLKQTSFLPQRRRKRNAYERNLKGEGGALIYAAGGGEIIQHGRNRPRRAWRAWFMLLGIDSPLREAHLKNLMTRDKQTVAWYHRTLVVTPMKLRPYPPPEVDPHGSGPHGQQEHRRRRVVRKRLRETGYKYVGKGKSMVNGQERINS